MIHITKDNALSLHSRSKDVPEPLTPENKALLDEMLQYLKDSQDPSFREAHPGVREGIGLAAPQVGHNMRMLVIYYPIDEKTTIAYELVNPRIISNSIRKCYLQSGEGCLSVDSPHPGNVFRDFRVTVAAYDALAHDHVKIKAEGFDAIVLQHEIDHLNGILFYDHIDQKNPDAVLPGAVAI